ncbi:MAG TPA: vitamin K epoxide reductase family protein [Longimicrobiaceae bacterium]|nr:vitamin K epoxide reductase family protein [Longimicrobiaceae bacterium]
MKDGMGKRGVTRGMGDPAMGHGEMAGGMQMSEDDRREMLYAHHRQTLWIPWLVILLGVWTAVAPFSFGYLDPAQWVTPSGGRGVWLGDELHTALRASLMTWSDVISGLLLVVFGWRALTPDRPKSWWICCFVGIWLSLAPLIFWSPASVAFLNDTLVGALVIALTVLIPGMPNMIKYMRMGPPTPPGWSYNPSSWPQRSIMIGLAFAGWLVSRYLAAFQLGYTTVAWDPFFGDSTRRVLNSEMSHMWPISDAALGTFAYTFEFLMGWMGSPQRWRTMPWMVAFFGILVIPLGLVHIALVISQPVVVGAWCTFCLLAAAIMLPMIPLTVDEVIAMVQNLKTAHRNGESVWRAFWKGGPPEGSTEDERTPEIYTFPDQPGKVLKSSLWGMSAPWTLVVSTVIGIWLMFVPAMVGLEGLASDLNHIGGALVVVVAVIAMGEPLRSGRLLNGLLGLCLIVAPWTLSGFTAVATWSSVIAGAALIVLCLPSGPVRERFGNWDRLVF